MVFSLEAGTLTYIRDAIAGMPKTFKELGQQAGSWVKNWILLGEVDDENASRSHKCGRSNR
jgi:hypothetical protein